MFKKVFNFLLIILVIMGLYAAEQVFEHGLGITNLNNIFVFGLWIVFDIVLIAIASGAACASAICYIGGREDLREFLPFSVALSLLCYAAAGGILLLELGQPLRFWFPLRHPNFSSMLAEITFCLTLYGAILFTELLLAILKNGRLGRKASKLKVISRLLFFAAVVGIFLSILHQGSLGGVFGALKMRLFSARPGLFIWPWIFIPFAASAFAGGCMFALVAGKIAEKFTKKRMLSSHAFAFLLKVCAAFLAISFLSNTADILLWRYYLLPAAHTAYSSMFYGWVYGEWLLYVEILPGTLLPLIILLVPKLREKKALVYVAAALVFTGLVVNRYIFALQSVARPVYLFDSWEVYVPNMYEVLPCIAGVAFIILAMQFLYKKRWI